jgi:transcriptional regulator with XRE-family HTH domain
MAEEEKKVFTFIPSEAEAEAYKEVIDDVVKGRQVIRKSYNQFNGRSLMECIDDWTKRWNGYLPYTSALNQDKSNMFFNFTRNLVISYLSKVGLQLPDIKVIALNKESGMENHKMADALNDLNDYSNLEENAQSKFLATTLEAATKGTVIKYEGYLSYEQDAEVPEDFDPNTGEMKTRKEKRIVFDNCFQEMVPVEDLYIANPYQPDIQKQPFLVWRIITSFSEAEMEYGNYPKFKFVKAGNYSTVSEPTTFYKNSLASELKDHEVEILKYYNRSKNKHIILINGVPVYAGIFPWIDGKYPFAKGWHEPYGNDFFWGYSFVQKIMNEQDLINTLFNMMVDKTYGSLTPFGLSSDLDDLADDTVMETGKIRKVGDINNWKFETLPGVQQGEEAMLQNALSFIRENSSIDGSGAASPQGGKVTMRQAVLKQQEVMAKLGFTINYLEDFERDRTELRISHLLQFYSIPRMEKITGTDGKEFEKLTYRDISLPNSKLSNGEEGTKIIQLTNNAELKDSNKRKKLQDDMSRKEAMSEHMGTKAEVLAINVDSFLNYNYRVQVVKNSSYEHNQMLDRAERMELANWLISMMQMGVPIDATEITKYVLNTYDASIDQFLKKGGGPTMGQPGQPPQPGQAPKGQPKPQPAKVQPNKMLAPGAQLNPQMMMG